MTLKKQPTTSEGTTSKNKSVVTVGDIIPPSGLSPITEDTISTLSHGDIRDIHLPSVYETQLLQMFADMKELAKQQALFDREREQDEQDRVHTARKQEEMKHLNHLLA